MLGSDINTNGNACTADRNTAGQNDNGKGNISVAENSRQYAYNVTNKKYAFASFSQQN